MCSVIQSDISGNSVDNDTFCECSGQMRAEKYLRKSYYHRIKCFVANFLATLMRRRPLNSAALIAPTHRGPKRVFDGINTQVVDWMTNKWRAKIVSRELYNVKDPLWRRIQR